MSILKNNFFAIIFFVLILLFAYNFNIEFERNALFPEKSIEETSNLFITTCEQFQNKKNCLRSLFYNLSYSKGHEFSFSVLLLMQKKTNDTNDCHDIAHSIGSGSFERNSNKKDLLRIISSVCSYGAIHGVIESYLISFPNETILDPSTIKSICEGSHQNCYHGLGHILLAETDGNLSMAFDSCEVLNHSRLVLICKRGVLMEFVYPPLLVAHGILPESSLNIVSKLENLTILCNSFKDLNISQICWGEMARVIKSRFRANPTNVFAYCNLAPLFDQRVLCELRSIESYLQQNNLDTAFVTPFCSLTKSLSDKSCYNSIVNVLLQNSNDVSRAKAFCDSLPSDYIHSCLNQIGLTMNYIQDI